ncbi:TPA: DUF4054 domain-containing protein [Morganella morganii]|uniref:DUF4054 domain-containing protein n=1 Tax=Morganella morganii TaxID=582 RepID=UPI0022A44036|nr:DUF4054 domain-containing protein [Morganella morganii]EKU5841085.1 DUF4054 domain-containing protein [Morganella morganii]MDN3813690.1 DUF4054 domain-containing protein [Morganella morganii]HCU0244482.1 DUF4054 domain-containing protein [Morganella morganii]
MNRSLMEYRSQQAKVSDDGVVVFDVDKFREAYPSAKGTDTQLNNAFIKAGMLLRNDKHSCVCNLAEREMLLWLLVAHMDMLQSNIDEGNSAVGRASSASEGSVSVSLDYGTATNGEKWYTQTPYGAEYWALTSRYRSFLYTLGVAPMPVWRGGYYG